MSSGSASLVATARDRRNRRLATFKGKRGNAADRVEVTLDGEGVPELPTSPVQLPSTASDGKINNKTTMVPVTMALEDAASHSSKTLPVPPTGIHVLSMRTWDVDDAPRPRLSPRVNQTVEAAAAATDSQSINNNVPALLTLPDDLLQPHHDAIAAAALVTPPKLAPRWSQRPPSSSAYTPPRGQLARKVSSSSLPSNLSHGQYAANNNVGGASGASAANSLSRVKSKTTNVEPPDDVSSLGDGGVDDDSSPRQYPTNSLARMTQALQAASANYFVKMPYGLNRQERQLWETCMNVFEKAKNNTATDVKQQEVQSTHVVSNSSSQAKGKLPGDENESVHGATDETTKLAKELEEKSLALENAKMIITSLEQASGSLAADLRSKLKAKDDAIHSLTVDAADKQKRLDSLATQLRDLQRNVPMHSTGGSKQQRQLALTARLEKNVRDVHAQACDMKASGGGDACAMERVGAALDDSISAMKASLQLLHETMPEASLVETDASSVDSSVDATRSPTPVITMPSDPRRLHRELEEKTRQLHRVEDALKRQREETKRVKEESHRHNDNQVDAMRQEILSLREQCQTNMELLAKKERELAVLRDSLKVDDGDVGYISDDATEASELEETRNATPASSSLAITTYSASQTEALATLLAHGGGQIFSDSQQGSILKEMRHLHDELIRARTDAATYQKQWRLETESLVNAKMIISSLEKANKSMMQESRTRLHDSNTAIASLLEKSMEGERTTIQLRRDLEKLRKEKEQEAEGYEMKIKHLRARSSTSTDSFFEATFPSSPMSDMFTEYKYAMETID